MWLLWRKSFGTFGYAKTGPLSLFLIGIRAAVKFASLFSSVCERSGSHAVHIHQNSG